MILHDILYCINLLCHTVCHDYIRFVITSYIIHMSIKLTHINNILVHHCHYTNYTFG